MQISQNGEISAKGSVVALGMFDGVHIGHRVLLEKARVIATRHRLPMVVHTFAEHPIALLEPTKTPPLLTTFAERATLMEQAGADVFSAVPFTAKIRDMLPEEFVGELVRQWKPKAVVIGFNYSFGRRGAGTPALMRELGHALGFQTYVVPAIRVDSKPVSATAIRTLLAGGQVAQARMMLGRMYTREYAVQNQERGRYTVRAEDNGKLLPPKGLYRVLAQSESHTVPALLRVETQNRAVCTLLGDRKLPDAATFRFITEWPPQRQVPGRNG